MVSVFIGASFFVLVATGLFAFFLGYNDLNMVLHVIFGWLFLIGAALHFRNNIKPIKFYLQQKRSWWLVGVASVLTFGFSSSMQPFTSVSQWYLQHKTKLPRQAKSEFSVYNFTAEAMPNLEVEMMAGEHFWFPQVVIWLEDTAGNYLQTLLVTHSTAKGQFFSGRSKANYQDGTSIPKAAGSTPIRIDALPYWSHKRGVLQTDGLFAPSAQLPVTDGLTGATPQGSFLLKSVVDTISNFKVLVEINVAFDDNEFFSEFEYPDDTLYHSGGGLLGQPSLIYQVNISEQDNKRYYIMERAGHGHHSGQTGELYKDLSRITTASRILERIIVKYN